MVDQAFGRLRPVPEVPRFRQHPGRLWTVLGAAVLNSCPRELALGSRAPGVDQQSRATQARFRGPAGSTRSQRRLGPVNEAPWVNKMARATLAWLRGPAVWTSCPGPLAVASMGPRDQPGVPGDWGPGLKALGIDQLSRVTRARIRGPLFWTSCPGPLAFAS